MSLRLSLDDRKILLADATRYFTAAERMLRSCGEIDPSCSIPVPLFGQDFGIWNGEITFTSGHVLKFREAYSRHSDGLLERIVNYDFRLKHASEVTFRVDAHGLPIIDAAELHVDLPNGTVVTERDVSAKGYTLAYFTMIDMICLICAHIEGKALPWQ
jgi:hypothetical protein